MFLFQKISNQGSSNIINARIFLGLSEILSFTKISKEDKEEIKALLFELDKNIRKAHLSAMKVMSEYDAQEKAIQNKKSCELLECPSLLTLDNCEVEVFINFSKKALRDISTIVGIIFEKHKLLGKKCLYPINLPNLSKDLQEVLLRYKLDKDLYDKFQLKHKQIIESEIEIDMIFQKIYKKARFDRILNDLKLILPNDSVLIDILTKNTKWATQLSLFRDEDEHPKDTDSFVINYRIDSKLEIVRPVFYDGTPLNEFLQTSSKNIFVFSEELILYALMEKLPEMLEILEIPEEVRDSKLPKRFKVVPLGIE